MESRAIRSFAYDESRNELTLAFAGGGAYVYSLIPPTVFAAFAAAASKGRFVTDHIRDRYPFRKIAASLGPAPASSLKDRLGASLADDE